MIANLPDAKVHQTPERRNYVYYAAATVEDGRLLQMFFRLSRADGTAKQDLERFVKSAYLGNGMAKRRRPSAIRFRILAFKVLRGEKAEFAPR
jgi:hypothetical protein